MTIKATSNWIVNISSLVFPPPNNHGTGTFAISLSSLSSPSLLAFPLLRASPFQLLVSGEQACLLIFLQLHSFMPSEFHYHHHQHLKDISQIKTDSLLKGILMESTMRTIILSCCFRRLPGDPGKDMKLNSGSRKFYQMSPDRNLTWRNGDSASLQNGALSYHVGSHFENKSIKWYLFSALLAL